MFFFSLLMLKRRETENFRMNFNRFFLKYHFSEICISLCFHVRQLLTRTKNGLKNTNINPANRRKTLQELIAMFLEYFWANLWIFCASNVHGWIRGNQLCSGLNQYFSELIAEKISYFQSWFSIVQKSSESIRRSGIASQGLAPNPTWEGRTGMTCKE